MRSEYTANVAMQQAPTVRVGAHFAKPAKVRYTKRLGFWFRVVSFFKG